VRATAIIATLDEAETIEAIVAEVRPHVDEVLVVDGHSRDGTAELARGAGAQVIEDRGRGKGDALRCGIDAATTELVVFIDADGSHRASDIPRLLEPLRTGEADVVVGSRTRGGSDELHGDLPKFARMIGSDLITLAINYRFDVRLSDSQNGFRAMTTAAARDLDLTEDITTIEQEMICKALWRGHRIVEIPTHEDRRRVGESKIRVGRVAPRYVWCVLRYLAGPGLPPGKARAARFGTVEQRP